MIMSKRTWINKGTVNDGYAYIYHEKEHVI